MKRRSFLAAALAALALPAHALADERFTRGLLWRVEKAGVAPSHVYGTIHVPDARLAQLPAPVRQRFDAAKSLMLEFVPDPYSRERFLEAAMFMDRQTLRDKIGAQDFERAGEQLAPIGLSREPGNKQKPEQIEGGEEQIFTFDEFPMESQVALLKHSLAHRDELVTLGERTMDAYLAGDLAAIWRLREAFAARHPEIAPHQAAMTKRVVHDRSVVMAFRMQRELRRGGAFVALGALHLYGEKGVLALLEADGYRARRVL
jgi:hypothetical protein